jgi:hypothetical protein
MARRRERSRHGLLVDRPDDMLDLGRPAESCRPQIDRQHAATVGDVVGEDEDTPRREPALGFRLNAGI